jgi:hypothetical protein
MNSVMLQAQSTLLLTLLLLFLAKTLGRGRRVEICLHQRLKSSGCGCSAAGDVPLAEFCLVDDH